jgi:hypothetical protein
VKSSMALVIASESICLETFCGLRLFEIHARPITGGDVAVLNEISILVRIEVIRLAREIFDVLLPRPHP